jgi:hypothetical protein
MNFKAMRSARLYKHVGLAQITLGSMRFAGVANWKKWVL